MASAATRVGTLSCLSCNSATYIRINPLLDPVLQLCITQYKDICVECTNIYLFLWHVGTIWMQYSHDDDFRQVFMTTFMHQLSCRGGGGRRGKGGQNGFTLNNLLCYLINKGIFEWQKAGSG